MRRKGEVGQTLVSVAFAMVVLGAIMGLAIDVGYLRFLKRELQTAADAAAIAGAAEANYGDVVTAAENDAAANGFTNGANGVTVTVTTSGTSDPYQSKNGFVEVLVAKTQPTFFVRIVPGGATSSTVQARAVAYQGNAKACIYSLNSSAAITVESGASLTANCGLIDNGNLTLNGSGDSVSASAIGVGGSATGSTVTPTPQTSMVSSGDPLVYIQNNLPSTAPCYQTDLPNINGTITLSPGVYCGGIRIANSANVTFSPGLYVLTPSPVPGDLNPNNGLWISDSAKVNGSGVTFFIGANSYVRITSGGTVSLSAPTAPLTATGASGTFQIPAGVLIFQDPTNESGATMQGAANSKYEGALYFPNLNTILTLNGIGSAAKYTIAVAGSFDVNGNNPFGNDYSSLPDGSPIKDPVLAE